MKCPNCPKFDLVQMVDPLYFWCENCGCVFEENEEGLNELDLTQYLIEGESTDVG